MKSGLTRRLTGLLMSIAMLVSLFPNVLAEEVQTADETEFTVIEAVEDTAAPAESASGETEFTVIESTANPAAPAQDHASSRAKAVLAEGETYVLMNIPYAEFYAAELPEDAAAVDAVTSATKSKPLNTGLSAGSYHVNDDGSDISGVTYPVLVTDPAALSGLTEVTDDSDNLFGSPDHAYYRLTDAPAVYKTLTVTEGKFAFSAVNADTVTVDGATATVKDFPARHTDYEIALTMPENSPVTQGTREVRDENGNVTQAALPGTVVSAVVLTDSDNVKYGLRHLVNIWRVTEIGWNLGELGLGGKTITNVRYYTQEGIYDYPVKIEIPATNAAYVLMNIPYADFYAGEGVEGVDAVTTATVKTYNQNMAAGSYHDGYTATEEEIKSAKILGVTYPVFVNDIAVLDGKTVVTDETKATITVATGKSSTEDREVSGADVLFASGDYAYYVLSDKPVKLKTLTVEDGVFTFSAVGGRATNVDVAETEDVDATLAYGGHYTDFTLTVTDKRLDDAIVNAVIMTAKDDPANADDSGTAYAMQHVKNVWRKTQIGWNSDDIDLGGKTITSIRYITRDAVYNYVVSVYVKPEMPDSDKITAEFVDDSTLKLSGLVDDAENAKITVTYTQPPAEGETGRGKTVTIAGNVAVAADGTVKLTEKASAEYAHTVKIVSDNYADVSVSGVKFSVSAPDGTYVLMNIPYAEFYAAELPEDAAAVDAVTSATKSKPLNTGLSAGSYHVNDDGSDISGVTYPVLVIDPAALSGLTEVTDDSDNLFGSPDHAYYRLTDAPAVYKTLTVTEGKFAFSAVNADTVTVDGASGTVKDFPARHTDYEIALTMPENSPVTQGTREVRDENGNVTQAAVPGTVVSAVVLTDSDNVKYGLRHLVNIWRVTEIGWNLGELDLGGKTITNVRYYTQEGIYDYPVKIEIPVTNAAYVLMNIPYADFYAGEGVEGVDAVTTATVKTYNQTMAAGSYHDGYTATEEEIKSAKILGVTYPVFVNDIAVLDGKTVVTDETKATITVATGKSSTEDREVSGADVLFASGDYAYYVLSDKPVKLKTLTVEDGVFTFSAVGGRATNVDVAETDGIDVALAYGGHYTDFTLTVTDKRLDDAIVNAVILTVKDDPANDDDSGTAYAMQHVKNVWRKTQIGWNSDDIDLGGKTITSIRYITRDAVYNYVVSVYVKPTMPNSDKITAEFVDDSTLKLSGLADDAENAKITVTYTQPPAEGETGRGKTVTIADNVAVAADGTVKLTEKASAEYAHTVKIVSDNYADVSVSGVKFSAPEPTTEPTTTPTTEPTTAPTTAPTTTPAPTKDSSSSGGCYVATSVYGSYDCPEVWTLRRFRDEVLAESWYGRLFIRAYYAVSPTAVRLFGESEWFQNFWRGRLDTLVSNLQSDGFASTPYQDLDW